MEIIENCLACKMRERNIFCNLPTKALEALERVKHTTSYPQGAVLFVEGQPSTGIWVLCKGRVKLSISSSDGKTLILRIAETGEVLGLSAAVSGQPYALTAETLDPSQVTFIRRDDLSRLMRQYPEVALSVAQQLSERYSSTCQELRSLMLTHSAAEKLAKLILDRLVSRAGARQPARLKIALTHEEMAQSIGTSRETVTRLFAEFKKKRWIDIRRSTLVVQNRAALESLAAAFRLPTQH
jgi:CRP/FNR family transcriptional regulator